MMLVPRRSFDLFDDFFNDDVFFNRKQPNLMKTDIKEKTDKYIVEIDLPGCKKENIRLELTNGYLKVSSTITSEENDEEEKFVRRERYYGECSRSFYVGDVVKEEDIDAEFKNGILRIEIPKKDAQEETKEIKRIEIK